MIYLKCYCTSVIGQQEKADGKVASLLIDALRASNESEAICFDKWLLS